MDFKSLQLFNHLATSLHFGETAEAMYVSPSTLSRVIQRLEEECGSILFKRDNRSVALTHAGHKLFLFSEKALTDWRNLRQSLREDAEVLQGELSLYCSVTASQSHMPSILKRYRTHYPSVDIRLVTGDHALAISNIRQRKYDVSLAILTSDFPKDMCFSKLDEVPLTLIAPREWRINQLSQLDWSQHQVILPEIGPTRNVTIGWFESRGIKPKIYASVGGNEAIVSMVALGCGVGFVPDVVLAHSTTASNVTQIAVEDIASHIVGFCSLESRQDEPLINALLQLDAS